MIVHALQPPVHVDAAEPSAGKIVTNRRNEGSFAASSTCFGKSFFFFIIFFTNFTLQFIIMYMMHLKSHTSVMLLLYSKVL